MADPRRPYALHLTERADQDIKSLPSLAPRFLTAIQTLRENPERGHILHGDLSPSRSRVLSAGQGGYRAVYLIYEDLHAFVVFAIGPHRTVYDIARKRYPPPRPSE